MCSLVNSTDSVICNNNLCVNSLLGGYNYDDNKRAKKEANNRTMFRRNVNSEGKHSKPQYGPRDPVVDENNQEEDNNPNRLLFDIFQKIVTTLNLGSSNIAEYVNIFLKNTKPVGKDRKMTDYGTMFTNARKSFEKEKKSQCISYWRSLYPSVDILDNFYHQEIVVVKQIGSIVVGMSMYGVVNISLDVYLNLESISLEEVEYKLYNCYNRRMLLIFEGMEVKKCITLNGFIFIKFDIVVGQGKLTDMELFYLFVVLGHNLVLGDFMNISRVGSDFNCCCYLDAVNDRIIGNQYLRIDEVDNYIIYAQYPIQVLTVGTRSLPDNEENRLRVSKQIEKMCPTIPLEWLENTVDKVLTGIARLRIKKSSTRNVNYLQEVSGKYFDQTFIDELMRVKSGGKFSKAIVHRNVIYTAKKIVPIDDTRISIRDPFKNISSRGVFDLSRNMFYNSEDINKFIMLEYSGFHGSSPPVFYAVVNENLPSALLRFLKELSVDTVKGDMYVGSVAKKLQVSNMASIIADLSKFHGITPHSQLSKTSLYNFIKHKTIRASRFLELTHFRNTSGLFFSIQGKSYMARIIGNMSNNLNFGVHLQSIFDPIMCKAIDIYKKQVEYWSTEEGFESFRTFYASLEHPKRQERLNYNEVWKNIEKGVSISMEIEARLKIEAAKFNKYARLFVTYKEWGLFIPWVFDIFKKGLHGIWNKYGHKVLEATQDLGSVENFLAAKETDLICGKTNTKSFFHYHILLYPYAEDLRKLFSNLWNKRNHGLGYGLYGGLFGDDSCVTISWELDLYTCNMDISSCDTSIGSGLFDVVATQLSYFFSPSIANAFLKQHRQPIKLFNPSSNKHGEYVLLEPKEPVLGSGSTVTTYIGTLGNLSILDLASQAIKRVRQIYKLLNMICDFNGLPVCLLLESFTVDDKLYSKLEALDAWADTVTDLFPFLDGFLVLDEDLGSISVKCSLQDLYAMEAHEWLLQASRNVKLTPEDIELYSDIYDVFITNSYDKPIMPWLQLVALRGGFSVTLDTVNELEDFQFLKRSPYESEDGTISYFMNIGAIIRSLGFVEGGLQKKHFPSLTEEEFQAIYDVEVAQVPGKSVGRLYLYEQFMGAVIASLVHEPGNRILDALRDRFPRNVIDVEPDTKFEIVQEADPGYVSDAVLFRRYGITVDEIDTLVCDIKNLSIGVFLHGSGIDKILKKDYGYGEYQENKAPLEQTLFSTSYMEGPSPGTPSFNGDFKPPFMDSDVADLGPTNNSFQNLENIHFKTINKEVSLIEGEENTIYDLVVENKEIIPSIDVPENVKIISDDPIVANKSISPTATINWTHPSMKLHAQHGEIKIHSMVYDPRDKTSDSMFVYSKGYGVIYNDNLEQFLDINDFRAGGGNGKMRVFRDKGCVAIPTGSKGKGFTENDYTSDLGMIIENGFYRGLVKAISYGKKEFVFYRDSQFDVLGSGIFKIDPAVLLILTNIITHSLSVFVPRSTKQKGPIRKAIMELDYKGSKVKLEQPIVSDKTSVVCTLYSPKDFSIIDDSTCYYEGRQFTNRCLFISALKAGIPSIVFWFLYFADSPTSDIVTWEQLYTEQMFGNNLTGILAIMDSKGSLLQNGIFGPILYTYSHLNGISSGHFSYGSAAIPSIPTPLMVLPTPTPAVKEKVVSSEPDRESLEEELTEIPLDVLSSSIVEPTPKVSAQIRSVDPDPASNKVSRMTKLQFMSTKCRLYLMRRQPRYPLIKTRYAGFKNFLETIKDDIQLVWIKSLQIVLFSPKTNGVSTWFGSVKEQSLASIYRNLQLNLSPVRVPTSVNLIRDSIIQDRENMRAYSIPRAMRSLWVGFQNYLSSIRDSNVVLVYDRDERMVYFYEPLVFSNHGFSFENSFEWFVNPMLVKGDT